MPCSTVVFMHFLPFNVCKTVLLLLLVPRPCVCTRPTKSKKEGMSGMYVCKKGKERKRNKDVRVKQLGTPAHVPTGDQTPPQAHAPPRS